MCHQLLHMGGQLIGAGAWLLLIVGGLLLLSGRTRARRPTRDPVSRSLELLNERYARGELDRDEYLERKVYLE